MVTHRPGYSISTWLDPNSADAADDDDGGGGGRTLISPSLFLIYKHPLAPQVGVVQFCIENIRCFENCIAESVEKHIHVVSGDCKSVGKPMFFENCVAQAVEKTIQNAVCTHGAP